MPKNIEFMFCTRSFVSEAWIACWIFSCVCGGTGPAELHHTKVGMRWRIFATSSHTSYITRKLLLMHAGSYRTEIRNYLRAFCHAREFRFWTGLADECDPDV